MLRTKNYNNSKRLFIIVSLIILVITLITFVDSEVYLWNNVILDTSVSTVTQHGYIQIDDSSSSFIVRQREVEIMLWAIVEDLPDTNTSVDWCNLTVAVTNNEYDNENNFLNSTTETTSYYYSGNPVNTTQLFYKLLDRDNIVYDMECHYSNPSLFFLDSILIGRVSAVYLPAFECKGCNDFTIEQLSDEISRIDDIIVEENRMYENIQKVIDINYELWTVLFWFTKIAFLILAVSFVFAGVYYLYKYFKELENII